MQYLCAKHTVNQSTNLPKTQLNNPQKEISSINFLPSFTKKICPDCNRNEIKNYIEWWTFDLHDELYLKYSAFSPLVYFTQNLVCFTFGVSKRSLKNTYCTDWWLFCYFQRPWSNLYDKTFLKHQRNKRTVLEQKLQNWSFFHKHWQKKQIVIDVGWLIWFCLDLLSSSEWINLPYFSFHCSTACLHQVYHSPFSQIKNTTNLLVHTTLNAASSSFLTNPPS